MSLTIHHRLLGLLALCTLACAVPATLLTLDRLDVVATARLEQQGLPPARALLSTVRLVQQHRGLTAVMMGGDESAAAQRAAKKLEIDATIERLDALVRAGAAPDSRLSRAWQRDLADWKALQQAVAERQLNGAQSSARHTAVIAGLLQTLTELNDHWALSFEPRPAAHFLVIGTLQDAPAMIELMGQTRARGANLLAAKAAPDPAEKARFESLQVRLRAAFGTMRTTLEKSVAANATGKQQLDQAVAKLGDLGQLGIKLAQDHVLTPEVPSFASADYYKQTTAVIDGMYAALDSVLGVLEQELQAGASRATASAAGALVAVLLLLGLAIANGLLTARRIRRDLGAEPAALRNLAQRVREGDLRVQDVAAVQPDSVMAALQAMQGQLARTVVAVRHNAESVAAASTQIAQGNHDLSNRTELQASSLQQTASTMEELGTTVRHNADSSQKADQLAREAAAVAGQGGAVVAQVVQTMQGINESARRIADITGVIDGIAFQTNILALNAAVEAARAGEQGRGFAVVASEVRSLAQRSADAAREIKSLISASVERVEAGSLQAAQAGRTMDQVVQAVHGVSAVIGEISQASQQQSSGVQQVGEAVVALDRGTQQNAALVEQTAAAAHSLQQQARDLVDAVSVFQVQAQPA